MCITNPLKISDFQGNLLHMLLFLQKHAFYFSILRIKEGLSHVQQPLFIMIAALCECFRFAADFNPSQRLFLFCRRVGEKFIPPAYLPPQLTSAGRRGRRPLQRRSVNLPLPHTPAGGYGIRPYAQTKPPCRGRACPARSLAVAAPLSFAS